MADAETSTEQPKLQFCSELLSPSELFSARSRSHKIPVRGQKDFLPTSSQRQRERLEQSLHEHWTLVAEERVERLGSVVKALWIPAEDVVELQTPAGKFWQTMGYAAHGKQYLLPEEALYLMECGNLQVFHHDLPLSIEEGYDTFLSAAHPRLMDLPHYQVFGHLKRLGYVVNRFDPSTVQSVYERQLNLPQSRDRHGRHLKRKRSQSPAHRQAGDQTPLSPDGPPDEEVEPSAALTSPMCPGSAPTPPQGRGSPPSTPPLEQSCVGRAWWVEQGEGQGEEQGEGQGGQPESSAPRWDFSKIRFPNLGSSRGSRAPPQPPLPPPDPRLLPGAMGVGECEVAPWLRRLNLRAERLSRRERDRQRQSDRYHGDVNDDREVRRCGNWTEYLELLKKRRSRRNHGNRPAHLWEGSATPLSQPGHASSHGDLLKQIGVIQSSRLLDDAASLSISSQWKISFDVYQPDTVADYKKSSPGKPYTRMCVCSFEGPVPDLQVVKSLSFQSGDVPVTFAVVDHGDISFYCFKDFQLPVDVYH